MTSVKLNYYPAIGPKQDLLIQVVEFTPTQADTVHAYRRHSLDRLLRWRTFATLLIVTAVLFGLTVLALPSGQEGLSILVIPGAALGGVLFPLAMIRVRITALAKRVHRQRTASQSSIAVNWSDVGFAATTATANSQTPWSHYFRWREDNHVILLYLTELLFQSVPKRVLSAEQLASLRAAAAAGGVAGTEQ